MPLFHHWCALLALFVFADGGTAPTVHTSLGKLSGVRYAKADAFFGVRFASQPTRFQPSTPTTETWRGVKPAQTRAPPCWAPASFPCLTPNPSKTCTGEAMSEDCLFLDIFRPAATGTPAPVPWNDQAARDECGPGAHCGPGASCCVVMPPPAPQTGECCAASDCELTNVTIAGPVYRCRREPPPPLEPPLKAVMVWIHGGGMVVGNGGGHNGTSLAVNGDVIVVSVNYRLGPVAGRRARCAQNERASRP